MAVRAEHAVETYFDSFHEDSQTQETRAEYVEWAVPSDKVVQDRFGNSSAVHRPKHIPFLWKRCPGGLNDEVGRLFAACTALLLIGIPEGSWRGPFSAPADP